MVLLTGGAGFIGSHVVQALLAEGREVRILDALLPAVHRTAPPPPDGAEMVVGDVRDGETVRRALVGVDAVCHQAGMVGLGRDIREIADYASHNDLGTAVLLRELVSAGHAGPLVHASSMVVYGEGAYRCVDHGRVRPAPRDLADLAAGRFDPGCPACGRALTPEAIEEDAPLEPRGVYAATKVHQEHLLRAFSRETGVAVTMLRYHNVYGPGMPRDTPYAGVASLFASALAAGRPPSVFEDGRQLRDFVHVRDVARANVLALGAATTGAYNVASGRPRTVGEVAAALSAAAGPGSPPPRITGEFRRADVRHVFAGAELARRALGFTATEDFADGMAEFARAPLRP